MSADYTAHLEARAAWYAAITLDLESQLDEAQTLAQELRAQVCLERIEAQIDAEGLEELVERAREQLQYDAERVAELVASFKPDLPR
jgi:hypothetical protein